MAGRRTTTIRPISRALVPDVSDKNVQRALDVLTDAVQALQEKASRDNVTFDLVVGTNRIPHGLGRAYEGANVTPTTAGAVFAWALSSAANPRPDLEIWIEVVGVAQPGARIEIY